MNQLNSIGYYVGRAESSRRLAQRAASPEIAAIHQEMVARYEFILAENGVIDPPPDGKQSGTTSGSEDYGSREAPVDYRPSPPAGQPKRA